jgi:ribonuclease E
VPVDVATFLLNEKRSDIHRIESRLKVAITLIPNPHLETPNYSISRLRQDDLTADMLQASYKLVEKPAEEKPQTAAQEQQKATRAHAVVQGITPAQPAPMKVDEEKSSILGKLIGWFKALSAEEQPKAKPVASAARNQPRRERGERGERGESGKRRERGERGEGRRERGEKPVEAAAKPQEQRQQAEREPRPQGEPRQPRPPRPPRAAPSPQAGEKPALETQVAAPVTEQAEEGSTREGGRRRGRRGGQRERQRREAALQGGELPASTGETAVAEPTVAPAAAAPSTPAKLEPSEYIAYPEGWTPPVTPSEYIAMPTITAQPQVAAVVSETTAPVSAVAESEIATPAAEAVANKVAAPATPRGEGLVQIETDPGKLQAIANIPAGYTKEPVTRRRTRQREVYVENEPLVQIETQRPQA